MNPKYLVAIVTAIFAASTYAAGTSSGSGMSGGNKPAQNGATNDMDSASPNKDLPRDSTQERNRYKEKSSKSKSRSGSGSTYQGGSSGTDQGSQGPGSGSKY
jgi:hypothetical protein